MQKKLLLFVNMLLVILLIGCEGITTASYKITTIDGVSKEEQIEEFDNSIITPKDLLIKRKEGYTFLGWSLDGETILNDNYQIDLRVEKTIYSMWEEKEVIENLFEVGTVGRVDITANDPITSKEDYVSATYTFKRDDYELKDTVGQIRLRGNSSLNAPKKSYKVKFDKKQNVFGFGSDKEWALIANYYDPSLIRNFYAYKLAQAMGIAYSVDCCFVEVYLNDQYEGLYLFCETVKTNKERVNIEVDYDEDTLDIPFLLELDFKMVSEGDPYSNGIKDIDYFELDMRKDGGKLYPIATKYPKTYDAITTAQYDALKTYVTNAFKSVKGNNYEDYFDIDSVIDFYLIQELMMNIDLDHSSVFFYREQGGKIKFGPVWDFDISCGNANYVYNYNPSVLMKDVNGGSYLFNKLLTHSDFKQRFITRLRQVNNEIIPDMLDSFIPTYYALSSYAIKDNQRWNNLYASFWPKPDHLVGPNYYQQVYYVMNYIEEHVETMLRLIK